MKKLFAILTVSLATLCAFAQGKVSFQTDSLHLAYWPPGWGLLSGTAINSDNLPAGIPGMAADLYMGTSPGLLYLYSSATFLPLSTAPGKWTAMSVQANANATTGAPSIPGFTSVFVEIQVRSTERAAPNIFDPSNANLFTACFFSAEFNFTLGGGIVYPPLWSQTSGNWPIGTFPMDQYGVGARGAIPYVPEPSALALVAVGAAASFIFRRKLFNKESTV
jgi:hypothetical protein